MSPFLILGVLDGIFCFCSHFNRTFCKQRVETLINDQMPPCAGSDLGLHCLLMSYKKDVRLIRVK